MSVKTETFNLRISRRQARAVIKLLDKHAEKPLENLLIDEAFEVKQLTEQLKSRLKKLDEN